MPSDPGAPDAEAGRGEMRLSFGKLFEKVSPPNHPFSKPHLTDTQGLSLGTGQCNVKHYNRYLRDMIISGKADPSWVVSHVVGIDEAPEAYRKFDARVEGYTKVLIRFE